MVNYSALLIMLDHLTIFHSLVPSIPTLCAKINQAVALGTCGCFPCKIFKSASGQERTLTALDIMSALPPKADISEGCEKCLLMTQSGHSLNYGAQETDVGRKGWFAYL